MNQYKLIGAGVNLNEAVARFNGNEKLYEKFLLRFPEDENFNRLCLALQKQDAVTAFTAAHTLKGITGNLSLTRLYNDLFPLVEDLRRGELSCAEDLMKAVTLDYNEIIAALV